MCARGIGTESQRRIRIANFPGSNAVTQLLFKLGTPHANSHDLMSDSDCGAHIHQRRELAIHTHSPTLHTHTRQ